MHLAGFPRISGSSHGGGLSVVTRASSPQGSWRFQTRNVRLFRSLTRRRSLGSSRKQQAVQDYTQNSKRQDSRSSIALLILCEAAKNNVMVLASGSEAATTIRVRFASKSKRVAPPLRLPYQVTNHMALPDQVSKADVSTTHPHDWSYVSEGGATIVFSYSGPPSKEFSGTVLRLRKIVAEPPPKEIYKPLDIAEGIDQASSEEDDGYDTSSSEDEDEPDDPTIAFQSRITSKLIPPEYLPRLEPAKLKRHFLEKLSKRGDKKRPQSRKDVDRIDTHKKKGVIATDLIGGSGWAVEIKPKWAFLPNPAHLSDTTKATKASHCRFCMHTHERSIKAPSKFKTVYCPLDLFSGDQERIRKALRDLWDAWVGSNGTTNNLKIFVHGSNIAPNDIPHLQMLYDDLKLLGEGRPTSESGLLNAIFPAFADALLPVLLDTPVLKTLAKLQRTLDPLDIKGLSKLWKTDPNPQTPSSAAVGVGSREVKLGEWETFLNEYLEEMQKPKEELEREWANPSHAKLRYYLTAYLMSATFKDCSVILRFAPRERPTITAIDLDPKSVDRLAKWEKLDNEIVGCFVESGDKAKLACVDARVG